MATGQGGGGPSPAKKLGQLKELLEQKLITQVPRPARRRTWSNPLAAVLRQRARQHDFDVQKATVLQSVVGGGASPSPIKLSGTSRGNQLGNPLNGTAATQYEPRFTTESPKVSSGLHMGIW
jgi:hypothetical protein